MTDIEEFVNRFQVKLPKEHWDKIVVVDREKGIYRYSGLIEVEGFPDFFYIPGFESYALSRKLALINVQRKTLKIWSVVSTQKNKPGNRTGYRCSICNDNTGQRKSLLRHRASALVFIPFDDVEKFKAVNHKNGVPGDDLPDNLEWCTIAENNQHAYDEGLYREGKVKPVVYWDLATGIEKHYPSVFSCMKVHGFNETMVRERLKIPFVRWSDGHQFKLDDGSDWPAFTETRKAFSRRQVAARNIFTGKVTIYASSRDASNATNVDDATIIYHCDRETRNPISGYNFRDFPITSDFPVHSERSLGMFARNAKGPIGVGVIVKNTDGEEIAFFDSILIAAAHFGVSKASIVKNMDSLWRNVYLQKFDPSEDIAPSVSND